MRFIPVFLLVFIISCSESTIQNVSESSYYFKTKELNDEELINSYHSLRDRVEEKRKRFTKDYKKNKSDETLRSARKYLYRVFTDSLFHYWFDTDWDFNGTSEIPRKGNIACGYFVTTTVHHAGFKINRVQLAQQAASVIIKTLCDQSSVKSFTNGNIDGFKKHCGNLDDGLYILGLDNHVGFIQKKDTASYFIHSSGWPERKVMIEYAFTSKPIVNNSFFMIGNFLGNKNIIRKWINGETIAMQP